MFLKKLSLNLIFISYLIIYHIRFGFKCVYTNNEITEKLLDILPYRHYNITVKFNRRELVLQAERKVRPSTDNLIWIMPT